MNDGLALLPAAFLLPCHADHPLSTIPVPSANPMSMVSVLK